MEKKVIGAVGKNGAGKDTVLNIISEKYNLPSISMGDIVRGIAEEKGIEPTRANLNEISDSHFNKYGKDYFIKIVIQGIDASDAPLIVVSGVRTYVDAYTLRERYGDRFYLINVEMADDSTRLSRAVSRGTMRDPKTIEELHEHDTREEKSFEVTEAIRVATHTINNDGTLETLQKQVNLWVAKHFPDLKRI